MSKQVAGSKEQALRQARESEAKRVPPAKATNGVSVAATVGATAPAQPAPEAKANGATPPKESTVKSSATKTNEARGNTSPAPKPDPLSKKQRAAVTKNTASKKSAKANARTPVKEKPSKMQMVEDMLLRKNGASQEEMSKASGWPHVNLTTQLDRYKKRFPKAKLVEHDGRFRLES